MDLKDRHRNRPAHWSHRNGLVLELHLAGVRTSEIAKRLGYSSHRVSCIVNSPLFEQKKARRLAELQGTDAGAFLEEIRREAVANLRFLVAQREDDSLPMHERLSAARQIERAVDRVLPRVQDAPANARSRREVSIALDANAIKRLGGALSG